MYTDDPQLFSHTVTVSVTTDVAEPRNPFLGAEATRNFLLDFPHPKISLKLVLVKDNSKIVQEAERWCFAARVTRQVVQVERPSAGGVWQIGRRRIGLI